MTIVDNEVRQHLRDTTFPDLLHNATPRKRSKKKRGQVVAPRKDSEQQSRESLVLKKNVTKIMDTDEPPHRETRNEHAYKGEDLTEEESISENILNRQPFKDNFVCSRVQQRSIEEAPLPTKRDFVDAICLSDSLDMNQCDRESTNCADFNIQYNKSSTINNVASDISEDVVSAKANVTAGKTKGITQMRGSLMEECAILEVDVSSTAIKRAETVVSNISSQSSNLQMEEESVSSGESEDAQALLARAQDRIAMQHIREEMAAMKSMLERKETEIESLSSQLRRAVASKCDLVLAHTEMEKSYEDTMKRKDSNIEEMRWASKQLMENHCTAEKELLDNICKLTEHCKHQEVKHRQELDDWERMHRNEMLEKDFEIAKLCEEQRKDKVTISQQKAIIKKKSGGFAGFLSKQ